MKKNLALILCLAIVFSFSACNNKKKDDTSSNQKVPPLSNSSAISSNNSSEKSSSESPSSADETSSDETSSLEDIPTVAVPINVSDISLDGLDTFENKSKGWGQGRQVDELNRPVSANIYQEKYGENGGLFIKPTGEKNIYLTFDQGYENGYTTPILDTLKEKDAKAVFFVTMDYAKKNKELVQRMIDEGHIIGNHSVHHKHMPVDCTDEEVVTEIAELHNYIVENFNYNMVLFRPPYGEWSTRQLEIAKRMGYQSVFWSYAYLDYDVKNQMGVEKAFPKVTKAVHEGAIYLLHSVSKDNAQMLGDVIDNFREQGFDLKPLQ